MNCKNSLELVVKLNGEWPSSVMDSLDTEYKDRINFLTDTVLLRQEALSISDLSALISAACAVVTLCIIIFDTKYKNKLLNYTDKIDITNINYELKKNGIVQTEIREILIEEQKPLRVIVKVSKVISIRDHSYKIIQREKYIEITPID